MITRQFLLRITGLRGEYMITNKMSLNGSWELFYYKHDNYNVSLPSGLFGIPSVKAAVPGNVELDLAEAEIISKELFKGIATQENQKFEDYHWWYKREMKYENNGSGRIILKFNAVDCIAEYFINDTKIGESDNAFIPVEFDISDYIGKNGTDYIYVHIKPSFLYILEQKYNQIMSLQYTKYMSCIRKPAHSFGWDIMPRAVSAGIWRDVSVYTDDGCSIKEFSYWVKKADEDEAVISFQAILDMPYAEYKKDLRVRVKAECEGDTFTAEIDMTHFKTAYNEITVKKPKLWWPYGYGEANVYSLDYELLSDGEVKDCGSTAMGIRTVKLKRTKTMFEDNHCFKFVINGVDVMCKGSNWIPLDAYHSRDRERTEKALKLFTDTHCNIVRVWGGGVYESEEFYDYCDRHGIMIWQDFMMACCFTSQENEMLKNIKNEAEYVIKSLRNHPSLILWSGDNEVDEFCALITINPEINIINRKLLPELVGENDITRPYLESSPYLSGEYSQRYPEDIFPERHLWGSRDYYKASFYKDSKAHFVSETGYHGCPCRSSLEKIVDKEYLWPIYNMQWSLHSSDQIGRTHRVELMENQIGQLFGIKTDNLDDFIFASQVSQAEAKKYFIERVRIKKPYTSGIIWWNMLDGWPQMSDAVVDYFFEKKLAYSFIKHSQEPFVLIIDEMEDWNYTLVASNDTLDEKTGIYKVYDIDNMNILADGEFKVGANSNKKLAKIPLLYSDKKFLVIEWIIGGKTYYNHYLCGMPGFELKRYKEWLEKYNSIK